jgi:hypothetical protein
MTPAIDQLSQLLGGPVWDGNLISKHHRDELRTAGFAGSFGGWNFITAEGIKVAIILGLLKS